eukprot:TRINITY_DN15579_c0_g1_i1.p1 TRINITY_DN15579_c0_g1~~TRINITY_DN15579_c0_g1_i1.p1  ORF type:complete len:346 (+),score=43.88 TRINITY_DN15579_c0_g1_i1:52-1089(+)
MPSKLNSNIEAAVLWCWNTSVCAFLTNPKIIVGCLGMLCVSIAVLVITGTIYTYFNKVLPLLMVPTGPVWYFTLMVCTWLSFNLIFNYCMVLVTPPGEAEEDLMSEVELEFAIKQRDENQKGLWCFKCDKPRPTRAHHCPMCGTCVLKMDHHCPWINQCVGHHNHRYFVLFLLYLWLSVGFATVTISLNYFGYLKNSHKSPQELRQNRTAVSMCFNICLALFIAMTGFLSWTGYLTISNQTTIEYLINRGQKGYNPFHLGVTKNLAAVFGPFTSYLTPLLPNMTPLAATGHSWITRPDYPEWLNKQQKIKSQQLKHQQQQHQQQPTTDVQVQKRGTDTIIVHTPP